MSYGFTHDSRTHYPNGTSVPADPEVQDRNRETSAREAEAFKARAADRWFVYVKPYQNTGYYGVTPNGELTTWTGQHLATFQWAGPAFECPAFGPFPSRRRHLRARGIDGRQWYGTAYLSSGDYARIRVCRSA